MLFDNRNHRQSRVRAAAVRSQPDGDRDDGVTNAEPFAVDVGDVDHAQARTPDRAAFDEVPDDNVSDVVHDLNAERKVYADAYNC